MTRNCTEAIAGTASAHAAHGTKIDTGCRVARQVMTRMHSSLRTALITAVGSLLLVGCSEMTESTVVSLPTSKFCELEARKSPLSEDECEELCANDSVDECSVFPNLPDLCKSETAKSDPTVIPALVCNETSLQFDSPFADKRAEGRRPAGFVSRAAAIGDLGTFFASCHELEAASIDAFERLARELEAFDAPAWLVERARRAKRDEIRHARWTAMLARRHGAEPIAPARGPLAVRNLFEMALENAVEGVVRETYGAAGALYRAGSVPDPRVRGVMKRIAEDELRHAELSWDVAAFASAHLGAEQRRAIAHAIEDALRFLESSGEAPPALRRQAGLPDRQASLRILATIRGLLTVAPFFKAA
ncbi:MAG: putative lipoprotein [Labilithrix sp.]|nr:putative lipoprotein [Labilithrix sp.]